MGDVYMVNGKILSGLPNHAKDIIFDNYGTTLSSTNSEDAIKEVNSNLTSYLTIATKTLANSGTIPPNTTYTYAGVSIADAIPTGYKCVGVTPVSAGDPQLCFSTCAFLTPSSVRVQIRNVGNTNIRGDAIVGLICVKDIN